MSLYRHASFVDQASSELILGWSNLNRPVAGLAQVVAKVLPKVTYYQNCTRRVMRRPTQDMKNLYEESSKTAR